MQGVLSTMFSKPWWIYSSLQAQSYGSIQPWTKTPQTMSQNKLRLFMVGLPRYFVTVMGKADKHTRIQAQIFCYRAASRKLNGEMIPRRGKCLSSAHHQARWQYWQLEHKCAAQIWESMLNMCLRVVPTEGWGSKAIYTAVLISHRLAVANGVWDCW